MRTAAVVFCALLVGVGCGSGPPPLPRHTLRNSELRSLPRAANGRDYLLYVALPYSYATEPGRRYPVLSVCDGYWDFTFAPRAPQD
jgi:hypothetical protein